MTSRPITDLLDQALASRETLFDSRHESAFRLFNGFTEGCPDLVIDLYAKTLLFHNYADDPIQGESDVKESLAFIQNHPKYSGWLRAGMVKTRNGKTLEEKRGKLLFGENPDRKIKEHGVWYSIDLMINRDASFYLDTRNLRKWLIENSAGKSVLNAFAYTGSLGVAAMAGGASRAVHLDRNRQFLNIGKTSYTLNGFPIPKGDFITGDFFIQVSKFKRRGETFDCVIVDPPFFSTTSKGKVDQVSESARLINKVRPLINDGGYLIAVNNALYVSGSDTMQTLESLCKDGYLKIMELIPVPEDVTGYPETRTGNMITDPAPFNHSTKIAVLEVRRKRAEG
jgi:23S rRNA (cytosine1962-C5)-methyltransferase